MQRHTSWEAMQRLQSRSTISQWTTSKKREKLLSNQLLKRKPYPIPNISDLLQKLEGFTYATALDLNMGYYHIKLSLDASKKCTIYAVG